MPTIIKAVSDTLRIIVRAFVEYGYMTPFGPWWMRRTPISASDPEGGAGTR